MIEIPNGVRKVAKSLGISEDELVAIFRGLDISERHQEFQQEFQQEMLNEPVATKTKPMVMFDNSPRYGPPPARG